jgi:hypothetical protein
MLQIRIICGLLFTALFLPATLPAQNRDEGEFVILSAQYGTERHHVDVTGRLKELARADRRLEVRNNLFGVDPDRGQFKTLRIFARGPRGGERMFEFREYSVIDGAMFRSWGGGDWGNGGWSGRWEGAGEPEGPGPGPAREFHPDEGAYVILSAQYGTRHRHVDVTARLKELARADRNFRMDNGAFGVDPAPGRPKVLHIYARGPNHEERMFEYREGSVIDGSQFRSWGNGEWGHEQWSGNW